MALGKKYSCLFNAFTSYNHIKGLEEQLQRKPYTLPVLIITNKPFWELQFEDFILNNYNYHPPINFDVAV